MGNLLFTNVELYDGTGKPPFHADVAVQDDKIAAIATSGSLNRTGSKVVDGGGKALVARVRAMEERYDAASRALGGLEEVLDGYEQVAEDLAALRDYLESGRWRKDFEADEAGKIPKDIRRGVLSEDGLYNLLEKAGEIVGHAREIFS